MCGGGLAVMDFSDVVANLIGEAAGVREGMSSMKSTVAGGMMAMGGSGMADKTMNAMDSGGDWGDNETVISQYSQEKPLDFRHFWHVTEGMSSRAGIVGLLGFGLGGHNACHK